MDKTKTMNDKIVERILKNAITPEMALLITPAEASAMLERNENNRKLKPHIVQKYKRQMENGDFVLSPDMIAFDKNGIMWNGQNRLNAIVSSGKPQELFVVYGLEPSPHIDRGARRTAADNIRLNSDIRDIRSDCDAINMYHCFERMVGLDTTDESIDIWIAQNYEKEIKSFFNDIPNMKKRPNNKKYAYVLCAFFLAYINGIDKTLLANCSKVLDGDYAPSEEYQHIVRLGEKIKDMNQSRQKMREECFPRTVYAIESVVKKRKATDANRKINKIKWELDIMGKSIRNSYNNKQDR